MKNILKLFKFSLLTEFKYGLARHFIVLIVMFLILKIVDSNFVTKEMIRNTTFISVLMNFIPYYITSVVINYKIIKKYNKNEKRNNK